MAKMRSMRDFDFSKIGNTFELDEVTPKIVTEERLDQDGKTILGSDGKPRHFDTDKIIGYKYS